MQSLVIEYIYIILIILALVMVANKLKLAYPIVLVVGGLALSFTARFSSIDINPELVFFIFLPPLLYEAAWQVSWKEFWKWRKVIFSFAFPIVILTSCVVALFTNWLIPGFTLALGFLLGGIISPPDAISAGTIMRNVKVPKSLVTIAEGESLLNDAASLIVFRFALAAIVTGQFSMKDATGNFFLVIIMGTLIGLVIALIFYAIHRWLPVTTSIEIVLTILTPYCMYYFAEYFHYSGVLAVVSGGLFLSSRRHTMLDYRSRIQSFNVWNVLGFVLNGLVFMLIGLQLPSITQQLSISLGTAIGYGLIISLVLIVTRILCTLGASVFTRFMSNFIKVADNNPGWRSPLVLGWAGMRGVISLAMALSIPLLLPSGEAFPFRNLILFITFIIILVTLVFQGLTLPWLIRKLNIQERPGTIPEIEQERIIQKKMATVSLQLLEEKYSGEREHNEHINILFSRLEADAKFLQQDIKDVTNEKGNSLYSFQRIYLELLDRQRKLLADMNRRSEFDEDLIRKYHSLIDLEEFKIREKQINEPEAE